VPGNTQAFQLLIYCHKASSFYKVTPSPLLPTGGVNVCCPTEVFLWTTVPEISKVSLEILFPLDLVRRTCLPSKMQTRSLAVTF